MRGVFVLSVFPVLFLAVLFPVISGCGGGGGDNELGGNPNYVGTIPLPPNMAPSSLAYDGSDFWFTDQYVAFEMDQTGSIISSFSIPYSAVKGMAWAESTLWQVINSCSGYTKFIQFDTMGSVLDSFDTVNDIPLYEDILYCVHGLAYFQSGLWMKTSSRIRAIDASTRALWAGSIPCPVTGKTRLAFAGSDLWVVDDYREEVKFFMLDTVNPGSLGSIIDSVQGQGVQVYGLTWDGTSLWAATWNSPPGFHAWDVY